MWAFLRYSPWLCAVSIPLAGFYSYRVLSDASFLLPASVAQSMSLLPLYLVCWRPRQSLQSSDITESIIASAMAFPGVLGLLCLALSVTCDKVRPTYVTASLVLQGLMLPTAVLCLWGLWRAQSQNNGSFVKLLEEMSKIVQRPGNVRVLGPLGSVCFDILLGTAVISLGCVVFIPTIPLSISNAISIMCLLALGPYYILNFIGTYFAFNDFSTAQDLYSQLLSLLRIISTAVCFHAGALVLKSQIGLVCAAHWVWLSRCIPLFQIIGNVLLIAQWTGGVPPP